LAKLLTIFLTGFGLAYACLWWSYERFYGEFGVSPQDVGLAPSGSASDLAGAAVQLGIWLLIVIALMALLPVAALIAAETAVGSWPEHKLRASLAAAASAALLAITALIYWWLVDGPDGLILLAVATLVFAILAAIGRVITLSSDANLTAVRQAVPVTVPRLAVAIAVTSAVIGITFLDLPTDAAQAGRCAATKRQSVPALNLPAPGLHLPILAVHAQPTRLTWLAGHAPTNLPAVYLGQANGSVILFNRKTQTAIRYPSSELAIAVSAASPLCHGVH
jgi:hypothetical protein